MSGWPADLRLQTRKILDGIDPFPIGGILQMKNHDNFSAYIKHADLSNGQIILYDTKTPLTTVYQSAGEMFDAGWIANLKPDSQFPAQSNMATKDDPRARVKSLSAHNVNPEANKIVSLTTCRAKEPDDGEILIPHKL